MRLLVIGAGFIGRSTAVAVSKDIEVILVDNWSRSNMPPTTDYTQVITGDATSENVLRTTFDRFRPECVFLAAGNSIDKDGYYDFLKEKKTLDGISIILATCLKRYGTKYLVLSSSAEVYGSKNRRARIKETITPTPDTFTGELFLNTERFFNLLSKKLNFKFVSLRYFNIFGSRDFLNPKEDMVSFMTSQLQKGEPFVLCAPNSKIDLLHIADATTASAFILRNLDSVPSIVNIGSGCPISPRKVYEEVSSIIPPKFELITSREESKYSSVADTKTLETIFQHGGSAWSPKVSLSDYLRGLS